MAEGTTSSDQLDSIDDYDGEEELEEVVDEDDEIDEGEDIELSAGYDLNQMKWLIDTQLSTAS